jgi:L,D-transpeptidase catalytic domain
VQDGEARAHGCEGFSSVRRLRLPMTLRRALVLLAFAALVAPVGAHAQDPPPPPAPPVIADGVTIAGVGVGGLNRPEAISKVRARFDRPMMIRLRGRSPLRASPRALGAGTRVDLAVQAALAAPEGKRLPLRVVVRRWQLRGWVEDLARRYDRAPRDSRLRLRSSFRPWISKARAGRKLLEYDSRLKIRRALMLHQRGPVWLPTRSLAPKVMQGDLSPVVVIRRGSRRLELFGLRSGRTVRKAAFPVAIGQPAYPTPLGRFHIVTKQRNPWWYPPAAAWAAGASPIPPGPGNPLGTRWMGLSVGAVGIHGTPNGSSIGTAASHGCIRMHIGSAEWLFERVRIGTTVFIVGA